MITTSAIRKQSQGYIIDWLQMEELRGCLITKCSLKGQVWNQGHFASWDKGTDSYYSAKKLSLLHVPAPKTISYGNVLRSLKENGNVNKGKHHKSKIAI